MAEWLGRHLPDRCRILVSPAVRAQQTAQALNRAFEIVTEIGPAASVAAVLAAAQWPEAHECVLVVGHQPTLGRVASFLLAGEDAERTMRTGAVWWFRHRRSGEEADVALEVAIGPDFV